MVSFFLKFFQRKPNHNRQLDRDINFAAQCLLAMSTGCAASFIAQLFYIYK